MSTPARSTVLFVVVFLLVMVFAVWTGIDLLKAVSTDFEWFRKAKPYVVRLGALTAVVLAAAAWSFYDRRADSGRTESAVSVVADVIGRYWKIALSVVLSPLLVFFVDQAQSELKAEQDAAHERNAIAASSAKSWGSLRGAITLFAATCTQPPDDKNCPKIFEQIVTEYVTASWVLPVHIHNIREQYCRDPKAASDLKAESAPKPNTDAKPNPSAKVNPDANADTTPEPTDFCSKSKGADSNDKRTGDEAARTKSPYEQGRTQACKCLSDATAMGRASLAYRRFVYAYSAPSAKTELREALKELHLRTRELGCALMYAGPPATDADRKERRTTPALPACFCSDIYGLEQDKDSLCEKQIEQFTIEDLFEKRFPELQTAPVPAPASSPPSERPKPRHTLHR